MNIVEAEIRVISIPTSQLQTERPISNSVRAHRSWDYIVLTVTVEDGTQGMGYIWTPGYGTRTFKTLAAEILPEILIGKDSNSLTALRSSLLSRVNYFSSGGLSSFILSLMDIAVWDVNSKLAGLPLYQFLGSARSSIPVYATTGFLSYTDQELESEVIRYVEAGYTKLKLFVGSTDIERDVERVKRVNAIVGDSIDLIFDANQAWKMVDEAVLRLERLSAFDPDWIEEPLPHCNVSGYRHLRSKSSIPIAGGENAYLSSGILEYLVHGLVDILQPDLFRVGGFTGMCEAALLSRVHGISVAPHLATELSASVMAAIPNGKVLERMDLFPALRIFETAARVDNGFWIVSDEPGHGVRFNPEVIDLYGIPD